MPAGTVLGWSGWRPTDAQLGQMRALGIVGCHRYETDDAPGNQWKACSAAEYANLRRFGFDILADFEVSAAAWRGGYGAGIRHGKMGRDKWRAKGHPDSRPISFAIDSNVQPTVVDVELALEYLRGCRDGGGQLPISAYGETSVIDEAFNRGITVNAHRAAAISWDSTPSKHASLQQTTQMSYAQWFPPDSQGRSPYDENIIIKPDWGQNPAPTGDAMALTFTLWQTTDGKCWRVDAGGQTKVLVPDGLNHVGFNFGLMTEGGDPNPRIRQANTAEAVAFLASIPESKAVVIPPCPPPPAVDAGAIATATLNAMSGRLAS